jgi:hypothetical protein
MVTDYFQVSSAVAKHAFFMEYLDREPPNDSPSRAKFDLARAIPEYVDWLVHRKRPQELLYVTNLCCTYLDRTRETRGTILIPDSEASVGVDAIKQAVTKGHFKLILPMSAQVFYHLCRLRFTDEDAETRRQFEDSARPNAKKAQQGIYVPVKPAPFLEVCGMKFHHQGIPVIPILHVKNWRKEEIQIEKYKQPMENARKEVHAIAILD